MDALIADIEKMRQFLGLSKRDLARKAEISEEYYWKVVTGKAPGAAHAIILQLAEAVNIKVVHFVSPDAIIVPEKDKKTKK